MLLDEKTYSVIYPKSYYDPDFEQFEFLLCWVGRRGELYQWLFENWAENTSTETEPINEANSTNVRSLILDELTTVTMTAENLTRTEIEVFKQAAVSKECCRLYKDNSLQRLAVVSSAFAHEQKNRFSFTITLQVPKKPLQR